MKAYFFSNSKINKYNIFRNESHAINYLEFKDKNFNESNFENIDNSKNIKWNSIDVILDKSLFDLNNVFNLDLIIIKDFLMKFNSKQKYTYWNIKDIEFLNDGEIKFKLDLNLLMSFNFSELVKNNEFQVEKKMIDEFSQFNDVENLIFNDINFFQKYQPSNSEFNLRQKNDNDAIKFQDENDFKNISKITGWIIVIGNSDLINDPLLSGTKIYNEAGNRIPNSNQTLLIPILDESVASAPFNITAVGPNETIDIEPQNLITDLNKDPNVYNIYYYDFLPVKGIKPTGDKTIDYKDAKGVVGVYKYENNKDVLVITEWNNKDKNFNKEFFLEKNKYWNWKPSYDTWTETDDITWYLDNEIILNFAPYQTLKIGLSTENINYNYEINLNELKKIKNDDEPFFIRKIDLATYNFSFTDIFENKILDDNFEKVNRSLFLPLFTDPWLEYEKNKSLNGVQDFLLPAAGIGAGIITGGTSTIGAGLILGSGLKQTSTILNRQNIKRKPNESKNNAINLLQDFAQDFKSRKLAILNYEYDKKTIAYEFHKQGYYVFNNYFQDDDIYIKSRFNYLKLSSTNTNEIFKDNDILSNEIILNSILNVLKDGIWIWEFKTDADKQLVNDYIFNFLIKNPTKNKLLKTQKKVVKSSKK